MTDTAKVQDTATDDDNPAKASTTVADTKPDNVDDSSGTKTDTSTDNNDPDEGKTFTYDYVKTLRAENADNRIKAREASTRLSAIEAELTQLKRERMTEDERLKSELEEYKNSTVPNLTQRNRELTVEVLATKLGVIDPEAAVKLLDWDKIDTNSVDSIETALTELVTKRPYLKKAESTTDTDDSADENKDAKKKKPTSSTSAANPSTNDSKAKTTFTRKELATMTPEQINAAYESGELKAALQENRITD